MSEQWQTDESSLQGYDREQADLERQTDALVLKTLTSLVSAADDLKARLRRDTDMLLEEFRRTKRGLENEISMAGAERQRLRDEADAERERVLSEARAEAERVVSEAHQERESLLSDVREMEQRLRALETQILEVLGATRGDATMEPAAVEHPPTTARPESSMPGAAGVAPGVTTTPSPRLGEPEPTDHLEMTTLGSSSMPSDRPTHESEPASEPPIAPSSTRTDETVEMPAASASAGAPASPAPGLQLIFDGVPGYQQAAEIERAVGDLVEDGGVEIVEFEQGKLVLQVEAADPRALADRLVAKPPLPMRLVTSGQDSATFQLTAG